MDPAKASALITRVAESVLDEANALLKPAAIHGWLPVEDFQHERITFPWRILAAPWWRGLRGASRLYLALCTIGPDLEKRVAELMVGDMMQAMALTGGHGCGKRGFATGEERIAASAEKEGLSAGMHANPGQDGWPIEQQRIIFSLVPAEKIGMRLTESCLMLPRKSVSFVIGCGEKMSAGNVPCDFCSKRDRCQWRNR